MPVSRLCAFVWWKLTEGAGTQGEVEELKRKLWQPPPNSRAPIPADSPWSAENETAGFAALRNAVGA